MSEYFRKYIKKDHYPVHPSTLKFRTLFRNCIYEALKRRTWKDVEGDTEWDIQWADKEWIHNDMDNMHLTQTQRVNHFRNHYELTRKDLMIRNLKRYKKQLEKEGKLDEASHYNFFPLTFNLPGEYSLFFEEFKKNSNALWIMKPIGKSQGKGIFLFNKIQQIAQWKNDFRWKPDNPQAEPYIVQRYIHDPLLIGGKKFDMRIYVLCTSYQPLTLYLYRTGFARFTHHRYDTEDINNTYVHLTNVAIQKVSENYDENSGGKWDLRTLKLYMISKYGQERVSEAFEGIHQLIICSFKAVSKIMINDKHCFELYGFDVLLDESLKAWLIEVNASPSMTANTPADSELKIGLLDDAFCIIDMEKILTGQEEQVGGFDLIFKGAPIKLPANSTYSTMLGCYNNRQQQLKKLAKASALRLSQQATESTNGFPSSNQKDANTNSEIQKQVSNTNPQKNQILSTMATQQQKLNQAQMKNGQLINSQQGQQQYPKTITNNNKDKILSIDNKTKAIIRKTNTPYYSKQTQINQSNLPPSLASKYDPVSNQKLQEMLIAGSGKILGGKNYNVKSKHQHRHQDLPIDNSEIESNQIQNDDDDE